MKNNMYVYANCIVAKGLHFLIAAHIQGVVIPAELGKCEQKAIRTNKRC